MVHQSPCLDQVCGILNDRRTGQKNIDVFVINVAVDGNLKSARPCRNCLMMMRDLSVRSVYYSTGTGEIIRERIRHMFSISSSLHARKLHIHQRKISTFDVTYYYEQLLIAELKNVKTMKEYNLRCFVTHNLRTLLPDLNYVVDTKKNVCTISNTRLSITFSIIRT
jgi:hypothetical protein